MSSFPYVIPHSFRRFVRLSVPPTLSTMNGWNKHMDRPIPKAGLTFHFAGLQLVYRNFCCELYFRSSPMLLFFASDSPRSPFLPDGFQCDTVSHTDETPCCLTLPRTGCGRYTWNIDLYHSAELTRHAVGAIHYCEECFSFF